MSLDKCLNSSYSTLCTYLTNQHNRNKRRKIKPAKLVPISFVDLKVKRKKYTYFTFKALFDSGASCTLASKTKVRHLKKTRNGITTDNTAARKFSAN